MAKIITARELAEIVTGLLTAPEKMGCLDERKHYSLFLRDVAQVTANYCGGEVGNVSAPCPGAISDQNYWAVVVRQNECLPAGGGIWANYDTEGEL